MFKELLIFSILCVCALDAVFSPSAQQAIVAAHNTLRSRIAKGTYRAKGVQKGPATNMRKMVWDAAIAAKAQAYAMTNPRGHSKNRQGLGENLYWYLSPTPITSSEKYAPEACKSWESEFEQYGWPTDFQTGSILHATQMAWAETYRVGCGVNTWKDGKWNKIMVVCQYGMKGNMNGEPVYKKGRTCSACPSGTRCESSTGLCA